MKKTSGFTRAKVFLILLFIHSLSSAFAAELYDFRIERIFFRMSDGTDISVSLYLPVPKIRDEKFPVLLELLPYRKDDRFALRDYSLYSYFVRRGFVMAKADVRGTGSSGGAIPDREYSEQEIEDAMELIHQLSKAAFSNGNVGMWGISWGGFNAIQVAMRNPPSLKAILAADSSDDLFKDDVHYIDGAFHVDEYELSIENDLSVPKYPEYRFDDDFFQNRFERYPWFMTYLKQQKDGQFWRKNSLRWQYEAIQIPVYLIGGLVDGYRDSIPRMLENLSVPTRAVMGPWNHAWPDDGIPGPTHEWRDEVIRWWNHWLRGEKESRPPEPRFAVFVRGGDLPDAGLKIASGCWRYEEWPIKRTIWKRFFLNGNHDLSEKATGISEHKLSYKPSAGVSGGYWWGEATGDMKEDDSASLIYDSPVISEKLELIGIPKVRIKASTNARLANWIVRLEDVFPDGRVSLVSGGVLNGSQRDSRLKPDFLKPGKFYDFSFDLHFSTWTFQPGHKIRVAVTNAQFPMIWPTPYAMTTALITGGEDSYVELPIIPPGEALVPPFKAPKPREESRSGKDIYERWPSKHRVVRNLEDSTVLMEWEGEQKFIFEGKIYRVFEKTRYVTNDLRPADSSFQGEAGYDVELKNRRIAVKTFINLHSSERNFNVVFRRQAWENERMIREKKWVESIPRIFH